MKYYKFFGFCVLVVLVFLYSYLFLPLNMDGIWNYGFGYNISSGLVPYRDFNMIIPPLWPCFLAFFIWALGSSLVTYYFVIAVVISLICFICFKKIGYRMFYILFMLILYPHNGYNIFCLLLFFILLFILESDRYKDNDLLIGIVISLMFLTKQTMGLLIIPSIIYAKNKKKIICIYLISIMLLVLYLIWNNNFFEFINYCFMGMFDFANNGNDSHLYVIISEVIVIIYLLYNLIIKKNFISFYILMFQILVFPIFEASHFLLTFIPVLYYIFVNDNRYSRYLVGVLVFSFLIGCYVRIIFSYTKDLGDYYVSNSSFINYKRLPKFIDYQFDVIKDYMDMYDDYRVYFLCSEAYLYKLEFGIPIDHYDLINDGNMGYNGALRYISSIDSYCSNNKCLFIINTGEVVRDINQINEDITKYVISNYLSLYSSGNVGIYKN